MTHHFPHAERATLHPGSPIIEGLYPMTAEWSVVLPEKFNLRFEDGQLVFWKPGFTMWVIVWETDDYVPTDDRLAVLSADVPEDAFDCQELERDGILYFAFRLNEKRAASVVHILYCFAVGGDGYVQTTMFFDDESHADLARLIWLSFAEQP